MSEGDDQSSDLGSGLGATLEWHRYRRFPYLLAKLIFYAAIGFGALWVLNQVEAVLSPLLVSLGLAYLLDPVIDRLEARGHSRTSGIMLILLFGLGGGLLFLSLLYPTMSGLINKAAEGVPTLAHRASVDGIPYFEETVLPWLHSVGIPAPDSVQELTRDFTSKLDGGLRDVVAWAGRMAQAFTGSAFEILSSMMNLVLIPVFTFYFLRDFDIMRLSLAEYIPEHNREWFLDRAAKMDEVVGAWFRGQVEVAMILAGLYSLGLSIVFGASGIGVLAGLSIGILAGLLNIVPYLGFAIGFGLSLLLAIVDWHGWLPVAGVLLVFAVVQGLEGYVVTPRIVGEKVGLSPVVVIIALLLGQTLLGLLGVLLALPVAGVIRVFLPDLIETYRKSSLFTGEPADKTLSGKLLAQTKLPKHPSDGA